MNNKICNCKSYNAQVGTTPEFVLPPPPWLPERKNGVPIDACIAKVVQHLWDNGVTTLGSCCGHNGLFGYPSIVLGNNEENYSRIRELIKEIDDRHFELSQWKRIIV